MSADESNLSEDALIKQELFSKKAIVKDNPSSKESTKTDNVKNLIKQKLDDGFQVNDNDSRIILRKIIIDELKLKGGWRGGVNDLIGEILVERGIAISDLGFKSNKVGEMTVNLIKNETTQEPETKPEPETPTIEKSKSTMPLGWDSQTVPPTDTELQELAETGSESEVKYMTETAQERLITKGLNDFLVPIYISMGIVEPDEEEKEDEAELPTAKKFRKNVKDFSVELNEYLIENDIKLPAFLNHISIIASIAILFVMPVVKWKFFSSKQDPHPKFNKDVDNIKVEV